MSIVSSKAIKTKAKALRECVPSYRRGLVSSSREAFFLKDSASVVYAHRDDRDEVDVEKNLCVALECWKV